MKNLILSSLLIVCLTSFFGCEKAKETIDEFTQFDIDFDQSVTVPATTGINVPLSLTTPKMATNSEAHFQSNGTAKELINEVSLKELKLTVTDPSGEDFSFLESIDVYITGDNLPELKMAWKASISDDVVELLLDTSNEDLQDYIKLSEFGLRVGTETDETIAEDHTINIHTVFHIDARLLN